MGFADTFLQLSSYLGIALLGVGILIALVGIIPALSWLFSAASESSGPVVFRRLLLVAVVLYISAVYLGSPVFYGMASWWKPAVIAGLVIGAAVPLLRADKAAGSRRRDRRIGILAALWWGLLVFSEALLVSDAPHQAAVLYLFGGAAGLLSGAALGSTVSGIARRRIAAASGEAEA